MNLETHLEDQALKADQFLNFFWHVTRSSYILQTLKKYKKTKSVLDVGAGAGVFFKHYLSGFQKSQYYFIEPIQSLRDRILKSPGSHVITDETALIEQDAVVLLDVLEHIEHDLDFLKNIYSRMPNGTLLILTCPALNILWSDWDVKMGHFRRHTKKSLMSVASSAGFEVKESRYLFHFFVLPALWRKFNPSPDAEFPHLSKMINSILKAWAFFELKFFYYVPFGTSVTVVAQKII